MIAILNIKQSVQNWLERKYQHRAFRQAVTRACATIAQQHPEWAAAYFDEHFLTHDAAPLLVRIGQGVASPKPLALAIVWSRQMTWFNEETRQELIAELTPIAAEFLRLLEVELHVRETVGELIPQVA
jgi:hypothetical protein